MSGHLASMMIQQSDVSALYTSDGNYNLQPPILPTYMTVSCDVSAGQSQVLTGSSGVVSVLPSSHGTIPHPGDYESSTTEVGKASNLRSVHDIFPHTSAPSVVAGEKIISISFQPAPPEPEISSLYQAPLENYTTITAVHPPPPSSSSSKTNPSKRARAKGENAKGEKAKGENAKGEKQLHRCEQCPATFRRSSNLKVHLQHHLGNKPFACDQCSASFVEEKNLKRHMVAHRRDRPYVCLECGLAFVESGNLTRHMSTHSGSKEFVCDTCGAAFSKSHHLKDHMLSHVASRREHVCEECQSVFNNPFQLRKHVKSVHSGGRGRPYRCPHCDAVFGWWNIFHRHLLTHKGQKPFVCEKCDEAFMDNLTLRQHKRTHARNKTNTCHTCGAGFDRPSHLVRHMRVHTGEKPNVCGECGAAFLERNKLARHMRIHNNSVGGVVCELCGARFSQTRHLTHHMKSHQDPPPPHEDVPTLHEGRSTHRGKKTPAQYSRENGCTPAKLKRRLEKDTVVRHVKVSVSAKKKTGSNNDKQEQPRVLEDCKRSVTNDRSKRNHPGKQRRKQRTIKAAEQKPTSVDVCRQSQNAPQTMAGCETPKIKKPKETKHRSVEPPPRKGRKKRGRKTSVAKRKRLEEPSTNNDDDDETDEYDTHFLDTRAQDREVTGKCLSETCSDTETKPAIMDGGLAANASRKDNDDRKQADYGKPPPVKSETEEKPVLENLAKRLKQESGVTKNETRDGESRETTHCEKSPAGNCRNLQTQQEGRQSLDSGDYSEVVTPQSDSHALSGGTNKESVLSLSADVDGAVSPNMNLSVGTIDSDMPQHQEFCAAQQFSCSIPAAQHITSAAQTLAESHQQQQEERASPGFVLYACQQCSAVFNSSFSLKLHKRVHQTRVSVCLRCGDVFQGSSDLAVHREVCTGFLPLQPDSSTAQSLASAVHSTNKSSSRAKPHVCGLCGVSFSLLNKLKLHMQFHTDGRKHVCNECGASFSKSTDLRAHTRTHTGDRPFVCSVCGASYTQSSTLSVHMKTHSGVKPHVCKICTAAFPRYGRLKAHMRCHSGEKPCICKLCGTSFKWSQTLLRHMNSEHGTSAFNCKLCAKSFQKETQLNAHLQVHSGERPHACPHCEKAFKKLVQLRRHSHVHTGNWPFLCEECGAGFGSAASLKVHMRCHTGEKPFVCEECGRAFRISSHLRRHIASHTDDPIYVRKQKTSVLGTMPDRKDVNSVS